jgi:hypothetical protein
MVSAIASIIMRGAVNPKDTISETEIPTPRRPTAIRSKDFEQKSIPYCWRGDSYKNALISPRTRQIILQEHRNDLLIDLPTLR